MTTMQINGSETDTLRLFQLDLPPEAVERFVTQAGTGEWPLKYSLGAKALRPSFVDLVHIRDLGEMTLSQYLMEAHGAAGDDFRQMRGRLDAMTGHVIILPSQAFDNTSQTLTVATPLRWIGTFAETKPKGRGAKLTSASAKGTFSGQSSVAGRGSSGLLKGIAIAVGAVILLAVVLMLR